MNHYVFLVQFTDNDGNVIKSFIFGVAAETTKKADEYITQRRTQGLVGPLPEGATRRTIWRQLDVEVLK